MPKQQRLSRRRERAGDPRLQVKCWCGAGRHETCVDHEGNPVGTHNTRGMKKKVVIALAKSAGLPWPR